MIVLQSLLPVIVMIAIGVCLKRFHVVSRQSVDSIKFIIVKILLPVLIFNALSTANYDKDMIVVIVLMLVMIAITLVLGHLARPLIGKDVRKYLPYLVCCYEGSMIAYCLYISIFGQEKLSVIASVDIAGALFGFSVWMGMLKATADGTSGSPKELLINAIKTPTFIGTVLGVVAGLFNLIPMLMETSAGAVYTSVVSMVTSPITAMILIVVGYDLTFERSTLKDSLKAIAIRVVIQAAMGVALCLIGAKLLHLSREMMFTFVIYVSAPPAFSAQTLIKDEKAAAFTSTTISLFCFISILVCGICSLIV